MSSMNQYYVIQNFKSYLAARAFLCQDYQKCLVTTSSRKHSKSPLTGEFLAVSPLSGVTFADFSPDVRDHSNFPKIIFIMAHWYKLGNYFLPTQLNHSSLI
jgi:hypothetical protein